MGFGLGHLGAGFGRLGGGSPAAGRPDAPTIEWDEVDSDTTPGFFIEFSIINGAPRDAAVGDVLRVQTSANSGSSWDAYLTHIFTSGEIAGDDITVSGVTPLASGSGYLARARIERGSVFSDWSATTTFHVDTAPTITSANTNSVEENAALFHSLTADEVVTWSIVGGADQSKFEISGSTLRWLANGAQDFEAPADADANNTYVVTVRATDATGHTTDQTITVTVTDVVDDVVISANPRKMLLALRQPIGLMLTLTRT